MNGNVKVYLGLAIIFLWIHTLFTAHELVSQMPEGGGGGNLLNAFRKMTHSSSFPSFSKSKSEGLTIGDDAINSDQEEFHVVFSTDCSTYQHWQSIVCFFSAARV